MRVFIDKDDVSEDIEFSGSVAQLIKHLNLDPNTIIIVKNDEVVTADEHISDDDEVKFLSILSGG